MWWPFSSKSNINIIITKINNNNHVFGNISKLRSCSQISMRFSSQVIHSSSQIQDSLLKYKGAIECLKKAKEYQIGLIPRNLLMIHLEFLKNRKIIQDLFSQNGVDHDLLNMAISSFTKFCLKSNNIDEELFLTLKRVFAAEVHSDELFPFILKHVHQIKPLTRFPNIAKSYLDLTKPHLNYPEARKIRRKIIYHFGPTNSGKTHTALQDYFKSRSAIYCCPLKLLAHEIYNKAKSKDCQIDLITGDEKIYAKSKYQPANHVACTIEMADKNRMFDLAVIDEVQMIGDLSRGDAWTQAILGLNCKEIHICGDESALGLIRNITNLCGDHLVTKEYKRLNELIIENDPINDVSQLKNGDCIVSFAKSNIYEMSDILTKNNIKHSIVYGAMTPTIKMNQCKKFNDPKSSTKILISTDAIGMGLNLNISRIIFSMSKQLSYNERKHQSAQRIFISSIKQIAGRAGRFNTQFDCGRINAFTRSLLETVRKILSQPQESIKKAIILPSYDNIYMLSLLMRTNMMSEVLKLIQNSAQVDDNLFEILISDNIKYIATITDKYRFDFFQKYTLTLCPIKLNSSLSDYALNVICSRLESKNIISLDDLFENHSNSLKPPQNGTEVFFLEEIYDLCSVYMWLSYRIPKYFPFAMECKKMMSLLEEWLANFFNYQNTLTNNNDKKTPIQTNDQNGINVLSKIKMNDKKSKENHPKIYSKKIITKHSIKKALDKMKALKSETNCKINKKINKKIKEPKKK